MGEPSNNESSEPTQWADFLERTPPGVHVEVENLFERYATHSIRMNAEDLQLYCESDSCQGLRFFYQVKLDIQNLTEAQRVFVKYICRNCRATQKIYALMVRRANFSDLNGTALKYGEVPAFGPPTPARVITLIGPDRDMFLRGRRAENQGLGIGAFAYYRRVVENQKGRLISEVAKVAQRLGATDDVLAEFSKASQETQFSKAIDSIKTAIPQTLLITGHNPLRLLHNALSEGIHAKTDEECLELATSIRVVLTELAERISHALKDEAELRHAIGRLLKS